MKKILNSSLWISILFFCFACGNPNTNPSLRTMGFRRLGNIPPASKQTAALSSTLGFPNLGNTCFANALYKLLWAAERFPKDPSVKLAPDTTKGLFFKLMQDLEAASNELKANPEKRTDHTNQHEDNLRSLFDILNKHYKENQEKQYKALIPQRDGLDPKDKKAIEDMNKTLEKLKKNKDKNFFGTEIEESEKHFEEVFFSNERPETPDFRNALIQKGNGFLLMKSSLKEPLPLEYGGEADTLEPEFLRFHLKLQYQDQTIKTLQEALDFYLREREEENFKINLVIKRAKRQDKVPNSVIFSLPRLSMGHDSSLMYKPIEPNPIIQVLYYKRGVYKSKENILAPLDSPTRYAFKGAVVYKHRHYFTYLLDSEDNYVKHDDSNVSIVEKADEARVKREIDRNATLLLYRLIP